MWAILQFLWTSMQHDVVIHKKTHMSCLENCSKQATRLLVQLLTTFPKFQKASLSGSHTKKALSCSENWSKSRAHKDDECPHMITYTTSCPKYQQCPSRWRLNTTCLQFITLTHHTWVWFSDELSTHVLLSHVYPRSLLQTGDVQWI